MRGEWTEERGISPVIGVVLLVLIVVLLFSVTGVTALSLGEDALESATLHSQGQYTVSIDDRGQDTLKLRVNTYQQRAPDTEFELQINERTVHRWDGRGTLDIRCLYPGDHIYVASVNGQTSRKVDEHYVEQATECYRYNSFPEKFKYAVVEGQSRVINERYAFGLSIVPNGPATATDYNGANDMNLGRISLANRWHYIEKYDRQIEGIDPPVFVVVMVDNVHWEDIPNPADHPSVTGQYNWTDRPPSGLTIGENSYSITGDSVDIHTSATSTEPTNDVFFLFKPGCDRSKIVFLGEAGVYDNEIYLDGTKVIDDTNDASPGETFTAPGVTCRGDTSW